MSTQARTVAVSPHELARKRGRFAGEIPIGAFTRLAPLVQGDGNVQIALDFESDERDRCRVRGSVQATWVLECQRCLGPVERAFDVPIDLCVVRSDAQARELDAEVEPFVLDEDDVLVVDLVEDDLLLALPSQVCVDYDDCPNRPELIRASTSQTEEVAGRARQSGSAGVAVRHPFELLEELKKRSN